MQANGGGYPDADETEGELGYVVEGEADEEQYEYEEDLMVEAVLELSLRKTLVNRFPGV